MKWKNSQVIKKIIQVELNKANNFTVNLNSLGLGTWEKGKIDYYISVDYINLRKCAGYMLELKDIGVTTPIYQLTPKKKVGNNIEEELLFTTKDPYPPIHKINLSEDCFMYRIYSEGTPSRGDSIWLFSTANGVDLYRTKAYGVTTINKVFNKELGVPTTIEGGWYEKLRIESYYEYSIYEYKYKVITDEDTRCKVIFIEKE